MVRLSDVAQERLAQLAEAKRRSDELERVSREIVASALREGVSYGRIGEVLGITRQAAYQRYNGVW